MAKETKSYGALGTVDSSEFRPTGMYTTIVAIATENGETQPILISRDGAELPQGSPVAEVAGTENEFVFTFPILGAYRGVKLRFESTAGSGTVLFTVSP